MKITISIFLFFFLAQNLFAQQFISLEECEQKFTEQNLLLLAEQYNISAQKAAVIQARIWEHPTVNAEINLINPDKNKLFDAGSAGQKSAAVQQLIYLGGKKRNEIAFAKSNVVLAELQFEQLLKELKFQLQQNYYELYFENKKLEKLNAQLLNLDSLVAAYEVQTKKNNVSLKDFVRLQSLSLALKSDLLEVQKNSNDAKATIKIIIGISEDIIPSANSAYFDNLFKLKNLKNLDELVHIAQEKNPDYLYAQKIIESEELMKKWQQSLAVPDLSTGLSYDQRGGAFNNQVNLTFGIALPLWNKNKGNIKMAQAVLQQSKMQKEYKLIELKNNIDNALQNWKQQQTQVQKIENSNADNLETVYKGMLLNFHNRNVSLLEFTDFMESYNQSVLKLYEIKKQLSISCATLNYLVNEKLF